MTLKITIINAVNKYIPRYKDIKFSINFQVFTADVYKNQRSFRKSRSVHTKKQH